MPLSSALESVAPAVEGESVSDRLAQALAEHFQARRAEIWMATQRVGVSPADAPATDPAMAARLVSLSEGWTGQAAGGYALAYPMEALGALAVYSDKPFSESAMTWARIYAGLAAVALDDSRMVQEHRKAITQLTFLVEASQVLNSTLDLAELLDLILKLALREIGADRGTVYLVDKDRREIWTILAQGLQQQEIRLAFGRGVAGQVAETEQTIRVDDAYEYPAFDRSFDEKSGYRTRSILCQPIRNRAGETAGILQLFNKHSGPFTVEDEEFLSKMSIHMALALENARLHREVVEKKRLERELQLASTIQRSLLPEAPPVVAGYDIAVLNEPCFECGGDYYDFLTLGPDTLLLVVADVEGKGVSSAMIMSNLQATLRALVAHLHSLEVITLSLNEMMLADTRGRKFMSAFLGLIDIRRRGLHYINAGHVPPLLLRRNGDVEQLEAGGMVIGLFNGVEYERGSAKLGPGDILLFCTDGIMEACNKDQDEFGWERLAAVVQRHRELGAADLVAVVAHEVAEYSIGGVHTDDKVLMVVKVLDELDPPVPVG